jgi:hypothetical protein
MRELNIGEVKAISGGRIRPSEWTIGAAGGALVGVACFVVTSFSPLPIAPFVAISTGMGIGAGLHATYDILHEFDL